MSGGGAGLGERGCGADAHAGCGRDSVVRGVDQRLRDSRPHCKAYESEKAVEWLCPPGPVERERLFSLSLSLAATHTGSVRSENL